VIGPVEIARRFGPHPPTPDTAPLFIENRVRVIDLAAFLDDALPDGREKALAFTALQETLMWANCAIATAIRPTRRSGTDQSLVEASNPVAQG
jgi:hypothetical protein